MKQIKKSVLLIDQVIGMCPTDADVIERLNSLTDVINSGEERHFDGSRKLIWLGVIVGILMYWMMGVGMMFSTLIATGLYVVASRTPQFLIDKRTLRGGGNIHNGILPECSGYWQERRQCGQYTSLMMVTKNILMIIHNIGLLWRSVLSFCLYWQ